MADKHPYSALKYGYLNWGIRFCNFLCNVRYTVEGAEKLPKDGQYLVVSNHLAKQEPMIAALMLRHLKVAYISKPDNFKIPIVGRAIKMNHYIPVDRENNANALKAINTAIEMVRDEGYTIGVCPEGTRGHDPKHLLPFRPGCFRVATRTGIPVLVRAFIGTDKIKENAPWRRTNVRVQVLGILDTKQYKNTMELSEAARAMIQAALDKA